MTWLLASILTVLSAEIFLRLPLVSTTRNITIIARRAFRALGLRRASDHWKERASRAYAARMMRATLVLASGLGLIAVSGIILAMGIETQVPGFIADLVSLPGLLLSLAVATIYVTGRQRIVRS